MNLRKTILVTGATSGIGKATAMALAQRGAAVIVHGRDETRTHRVAAEIRKSAARTDVDTAVADFSSLADVRALAAEIRARFERLDVLINNAALISRTHERSADGFELQWAVNHLAPFLLTNILRDLLVRSSPSRIVNVSSRVHAGADANFPGDGASAAAVDPSNAVDGSNATYHPNAVYGRTKLANILFTFELARRLGGTGVTANCLHPGVVATNLLADFRGRSRLVSNLVRRGARTAEEGSETPVYLALDPGVEGVTGRYFVQRKPEEASELARDADLAARLWASSARQVGCR